MNKSGKKPVESVLFEEKAFGWQEKNIGINDLVIFSFVKQQQMQIGSHWIVLVSLCYQFHIV